MIAPIVAFRRPRGRAGRTNRRVVDLRGGGTLTLELRGNLLELLSSDRAFICRLLDEIDRYEGRPT